MFRLVASAIVIVCVLFAAYIAQQINVGDQVSSANTASPAPLPQQGQGNKFNF